MGDLDDASWSRTTSLASTTILKLLVWSSVLAMQAEVGEGDGTA